MICSTAAYPSGTHGPLPPANPEAIYATNGSGPNKGARHERSVFLNNAMPRLDYWTNCAPSTNYDDRVRLRRWLDRGDTSSLDRSTKGTTAIVIFSIHS